MSVFRLEAEKFIERSVNELEQNGHQKSAWLKQNLVCSKLGYTETANGSAGLGQQLFGRPRQEDSHFQTCLDNPVRPRLKNFLEKRAGGVI